MSTAEDNTSNDVQSRGNGAQERTRTFTAVKPLAPEASASTNSATWARAGSTGRRRCLSIAPE